jgi:hypothetical protein
MLRPDRGRVKTNCILFALGRWFARGGYLIFRKSHFGWWPHAIWTPDLKTFEEFVPLDRTPHTILPPLIFEGQVRTSDVSEQVLTK